MAEVALTPKTFLQQKVVQLIVRGFFLTLLVVPVTLNLPKVIHRAHATDWSQVEDCDGDGKDDVTGLPVPWPGFDGTRGDTPAGPGTAAWWIAQQGGTSSSGSSASGSGGSSSDSGSSGSAGSNSAAKSTPGSSSGPTQAAKAAATTAKAAAAAPTVTTVAAPVAAAAATSAVATTAAAVATVAPAASAAASQSGSAVSSGAPVAGTIPKQGGTQSGGSADSLWAALTVGFTGENTELSAGLALLAALVLLGGLAVGVGGLREVSAYAQYRRREARLAEEPATATT